MNESKIQNDEGWRNRQIFQKLNLHTYKEREIIEESEPILDRRKEENKTKIIMYFYFSSKI
jgi:hypothetical protein